MNCPHCSEPLLQAANAERKFVYSCRQEHGLALGFAVLKDGLEPAPFTRLWTQARLDPQAPRCPSCRQTMRISVLGVSGSQVTLDLCKLCHLIWLDPGELQAIDNLKKKHPEMFVRTRDEAHSRKRAAEAFGLPPLTGGEVSGSVGAALDRAGVSLDAFDVLWLIGEVLIGD